MTTYELNVLRLAYFHARRSYRSALEYEAAIGRTHPEDWAEYQCGSVYWADEIARIEKAIHQEEERNRNV